VGKRGLESGVLELKRRADSSREELAIEAAAGLIAASVREMRGQLL
jgi:hypothetical protein